MSSPELTVQMAYDRLEAEEAEAAQSEAPKDDEDEDW